MAIPKKNSLKSIFVTSIILLLINLVFGYYFYHAYSVNDKFKTHVVTAKAEIINEEKTVTNGKRGTTVYYYIVSFKDTKGEAATALIEKKVAPFAPVHSIVDIVYDPAEPKKVRFAKIAGDVDQSVTLLGVLEGIVLIFSLIVLVAQFASRKKK